MSLSSQRKLASEGQDARFALGTLVQSQLATVDGRNADVDRHEQFEPVPLEKDVVPSRFIFRNFVDEDRERLSHTRLLSNRAGHGRTSTSNDKLLTYVSRSDVRCGSPMWFNASAIPSDATGEGSAGRCSSPIFLVETSTARTSASVTRYASPTSPDIKCVKLSVDNSRGTSRERDLPNSIRRTAESRQANVVGFGK